jgi:predicted nucleic-acid-binding Zn-ribbon protein
MKRKFFCPSCGNRDANKIFITNHNGKEIPLLLSSQDTIRKSTGEISCAQCKHVGRLVDFSDNGK